MTHERALIAGRYRKRSDDDSDLVTGLHKALELLDTVDTHEPA